MSKKIIIPLCRNPFDIYVNHHFYSYPAGEEVEVPDEVAEVIEQHIGCHVTDSAPPASGGGSNDNLGEVLTGNTTDLYWDGVTEFKEDITTPLITILGMSNLTSARFPTLKTIPTNMFTLQGNTTSVITSVDVHEATGYVGDYAFKECTSLTSLDIPKVTTIGGECFRGCTSLTSVNMPKVTKFNNYAFAGCTELAMTELPPKLEQIMADAFSGCSKLAITHIPASVTLIHLRAFQDCTSLKSITFKGTPAKVTNSTFSGCTNLTTINVPWAEGALAGAPWGAPESVEIVYNYKGD